MRLEIFHHQRGRLWVGARDFAGRQGAVEGGGRRLAGGWLRQAVWRDGMEG